MAPLAIPSPPLPQKLTGPNAHQHVWTAVTSMLEDDGWNVALDSHGPDPWNGRTSFLQRAVTIKDDLEPPQRVKTLLHEWAHITLEHDNANLQRPVKEIEAESVAQLVSAAVGLDTTNYSVADVVGWAGGDSQAVAATAARVLTGTHRLVERLERELGVELSPEPLAAHRQTPNPTTGPGRTSDTTAANTVPEPHPGTGPVSVSQVELPTTAVSGDDARVPVWVQRHGDRLDPAQRCELYRHLDHVNTANVAAVAFLLADAGCTAAETADVLRRYAVPDTEIHAASPNSSTAASTAPPPNRYTPAARYVR